MAERWFQEYPCKCNRGDHVYHKHYAEAPHACARCGHRSCASYQMDLTEKQAARILLGPEMSEVEAATILLGPEAQEVRALTLDYHGAIQALAAARQAHHTAETMLARVKQELIVETARADAAEKALQLSAVDKSP